MGNLNAKIEQGFEALARLLIRHRALTLGLTLAAVAVLVAQLPRIKFDTSTEGLFHADDPALLDYNAFRDRYGRDELIIVAIQPPDVFSRPFLERLREFHRAIEDEVPHLEDVTSLVNARLTRGEDDSLLVEDLLEELPRDGAEMDALRKRVLGHPLYRNQLIAEDGRLTALIIKTRAFTSQEQSSDLLGSFGQGAVDGGGAERRLLSDEENTAVVGAVGTIASRFQAPDFRVWVSGSPVVTDTLKQVMRRDMMRFVLLAVAAIGILLALLFRRASGVLLSLMVVLLSLFCTVGLMAWFGVPVTTITSILPSFVLAIGVGSSVHFLAIFYEELDASGDRAGAIVHTLRHSGMPILMTSLITVVGLGSFTTAQLAPIAHLGIFAPVGELMALLFTLVLLPALLAWLPLPARRQASGDVRIADRVLIALGEFATRRAWTVLLVSLVLFVVAALGIARLKFSHNQMTWFPESHPLREANDTIDRELKGSISIEVIADTGRENGMYEPDALRALEDMSAFAESYVGPDGQRFVGKTTSLADIVKEINQALHGGDSAAYALPENRQLIAQELLLFENSGSDDLEDVTDSQFSQARLTAKAAWNDAAVYVEFVNDLTAFASERFGEGNGVKVTGFLVLFTRAIDAMMRSMVTSYAISFAGITLLMIVTAAHVRIGLLSMVPNLLPIALTLGLMGWLGLRLDMFTLLIGSIAIGLAVEDTIHYFHNFRRHYAESGDSREAIRQTLLGTGRAMLFGTAVLVAGFWLFMFASLNNLFAFGLLTGFTLAVAFLADVLLSSALLTLLTRTEGGRVMLTRWGGTAG